MKDGTYIVAGVMVDRGKWYLQCFRWCLVSYIYIYIYIYEVLDGLCVWVEV